MTGSSSNQLHRSRRPADIAPPASRERTSHARAVERTPAARLAMPSARHNNRCAHGRDWIMTS
jgi:hypothetical protein